MKPQKEELFPNLDYKKLKVVDPEKKSRFPEIKLIHFICVIIVIGFIVASFSQYIRGKRVPPPTARDWYRAPPGMNLSNSQDQQDLQRSQKGYSLSY